MHSCPAPSRIRSRPPVTVFQMYSRCSALAAPGPTRCSVSWLKQGLRHWQRVTSSRNSRTGRAAGVLGHRREPCLTACRQHDTACQCRAGHGHTSPAWCTAGSQDPGQSALLDCLWLAGHQASVDSTTALHIALGRGKQMTFDWLCCLFQCFSSSTHARIRDQQETNCSLCRMHAWISNKISPKGLKEHPPWLPPASAVLAPG